MNANDLFAQILKVGFDVLSTAIDATTKVITAQIGDSTAGTVDSDSAEWWQHTGFTSRPAKPSQGSSSCQGLAISRSGYDKIFATRDTRGTAIYGTLADGETCVYAPGSEARTLYKANGAVVQYTTSDNTPGGQSVYHYVGPDKIALGNQFGMLSLDENGFTLTVGQAALTLTPAGIAKLLGVQVAVQGQVVAVAGQVATCLGTLAAPTPGTPGPTSVVVGPAGTTGLGSSTVFCSP